MFPMWVDVAVALAIAGIAFALAQLVAGIGVMFVIGATTMWIAYSAHRAARSRRQ